VPPGWGFLDLPNGTQRYVRRGPITNSAVLSTLRDWFRCLRLTQGLRPGLIQRCSAAGAWWHRNRHAGAKARPFRRGPFGQLRKAAFPTLRDTMR
jgi:hypothetical protein